MLCDPVTSGSKPGTDLRWEKSGEWLTSGLWGVLRTGLWVWGGTIIILFLDLSVGFTNVCSLCENSSSYVLKVCVFFSM